MARTRPFETDHRRYDDWFERHSAAYQSELLAVRALLGLPIGVGTGRFAASLGVQVGIDSAQEVLSYAARRGVSVVQGIAEALPFSDQSFDQILSVTTLCFVDDVTAMLSEAHRVLKTKGVLVLGFIDRTSPLSQHYLTDQAESIFYRDVIFHSANDVEQALRDTGFCETARVQTLSKPLDQIREIEPLRGTGRGQAAFVAGKARRG